MNELPALDVLNHTLAPEDDRLTSKFERPRHPVCFMIGLPRSAKTLFHQCVATSLPLGYVSNILGKFWRAPYIGACFEKEVLNGAPNSSFSSEYGNTSGAAEPNEWGWFWRHWLGLGDGEHYASGPIDMPALLRKLAALESVKGGPLIFNNVYTMANLDRLKKVLPNLLIVHKHRDPYWVCRSILNARIQRYGDVRHAYGHIPSDVSVSEIDDPVEQIVLQVYSIAAEVDRIRNQIEPNRLYHVDHEVFCRNPRSVMEQFNEFWQAHGYKFDVRLDRLPDSFSLRNDVPLIDPRYEDRLNRVFNANFSIAATA